MFTHIENFQELSEKIDTYFAETNDEKLRLDLEKAGYSVYKHVDIKIFSSQASDEA